MLQVLLPIVCQREPAYADFFSAALSFNSF
jgi:hypothetical protein